MKHKPIAWRLLGHGDFKMSATHKRKAGSEYTLCGAHLPAGATIYAAGGNSCRMCAEKIVRIKNAKPKPKPKTVTHEDVAAATEKFLENGGVIAHLKTTPSILIEDINEADPDYN